MTSFLFDGEGFEFSHLQRLAQINGQTLSLKKQQELLEVQKQIRDELAKQAAQAAQAEELRKRSLPAPERARGPDCPHCGGELPSDATVKLYAKCRHCASDLFWSGGGVYADQATAEEAKHRAVLAAKQREAEAQRKSYLGTLSKNHKRELKRLADTASEMPVVITGGGLEIDCRGAACAKAHLRNVSDRVLDEVRVAFVSDDNHPSFISVRERINPLEKTPVSFTVEGVSSGGGGSLWVSFASSNDGQSWEQSLEDARDRPRGVMSLRLRTGEYGQKVLASDPQLSDGEFVQPGACMYACALLCAADGKVTQREVELVVEGLSWTGLEGSAIKQQFVDACKRVRKEGESKWLEVVTKTLASKQDDGSKGMPKASLRRLLLCLVASETTEDEDKAALFRTLEAGLRS